MKAYRVLAYIAIVLGLLSLVGVGTVASMAADATSTAADATAAATSYSAAGVYLTTGHGTSMEPTMSPGDRALCVAWADYDVGDVVGVAAEYAHESEVRHRVVALNETHVVTKGDGNDYRDDPVSRERIRCTVVYAEGAGWRP